MSANFSTADEIITQDVIDTVSAALRQATAGAASAVKEVASQLRSPYPTVKNWFAGRNAPSATELIRMMRQYDEVHEAVLALAKRTPAKLTEEQADRVARALAILEGRAG